ncbi:MAG TPA: hypothetical protein VEP30_12155 [Chthoniobacterales bacterium]|nr:hypothetical protein [Chthoniobacterales bacterium]
MTSDQPRGGPFRFWIATALVALLVIAVWKFIDYRMGPPPPPNKIVIPVPAPTP